MKNCHTYTDEELKVVKEAGLKTKEELIYELTINYMHDLFEKNCYEDLISSLNKIDLPDLTDHIDEYNHPLAYGWYYNQETPFPHIEISIDLLEIDDFGYDENGLYASSWTIPYSYKFLSIPVYSDFNSNENQERLNEVINDYNEFKDICDDLE